jgi:hypothetical protein
MKPVFGTRHWITGLKMNILANHLNTRPTTRTYVLLAQRYLFWGGVLLKTSPQELLGQKNWNLLKSFPTQYKSKFVIKSIVSGSRIDWLIIYGFTSRSRIFHLYRDVTIAGEGLQNLGLCSELRALEQGGIFIVPQLLWHGTSVFPVSSEGPPHLVASYDTRGDVGDLF